jgi:hypothetical protein
MNQQIEQARERAKNTIQQLWQDIAASYTLGWIGPTKTAEDSFPHIRNSVNEIRDRIPKNLPFLLYQSRESPPKDTVVAVPFCDDTGNPYNCRLVTVRVLRHDERVLFNEFSQAIWFAIDSSLLPHPRCGHEFENCLLEWTGESLLRLC